MENVEMMMMMIQGTSKNKGLNESGGGSCCSKNEKNDTSSNGVSGDGLVVCWNKFLPFRSLRVLVVENDDSTRHVVCALMKKCGYEVIAVANGLQAWKVLEDGSNHVDIVLTEVVLPYLTGLGLLRKIMNHETRKNLPVIMMSPSDSLGVVFKCLSKGATDFLVKPIRKNELRTLWQHVWRKCLSSSGGGSVAESDAVTRSKAIVKSPGTGKSGSSSNDGNENVPCDPNNRSHGLSDRNGSDQGSGTEAPKDNRKQKPETPPAHMTGQLFDPPMHNWDLNHSAGEFEGHNLGDKTMGEDSATKVPGKSISKTPENKASKTVHEYTSKDKGRSVFNKTEKSPGKEMMNKEAQMAVATAPINNGDADFGEMGNGGKAARQRNVLGHSSHSAFSRYGSASASKPPKVQSGNEGSCSPPEDDGSEGANEEPYNKYQDNSAGISIDHNSVDKQPINTNTETPHSTCVQKLKRSTHTSGDPVSKANGSSGDTTLEQPELNPHFQQPHHYHPYHNHHFYGPNMKVSFHGDTTMNDVAARFKTDSVITNLNRAPPGPANMFGSNPMSDAGIMYGFMNGIAANCQLQRLAAIHKFRQKRKDRCFGKKVRCEGRKIIADQRPRMKGQFVRRTDISNNKGGHIC